MKGIRFKIFVRILKVLRTSQGIFKKQLYQSITEIYKLQIFKAYNLMFQHRYYTSMKPSAQSM